MPGRSFREAVKEAVRVVAGALIVTAWVPFPSVEAAIFELEKATIADIHAAFEAGALTSEKLVQLCLNRIQAYDCRGPQLKSLITLNPKALEEARTLDAERRVSGPRSPLHGIPVVVKDLIDTQDMPTTAGFIPMANNQPWRDAFVVKRLRQAGAILLAKANLVDWFAKTNWGASTLGGQVQNPYKLGYVPGGSSSGTGAAVGAYLATVGLGTETTNSVRNPAADNNLFGLAPTQGLISRGGVLTNSFTQDRVGPMARSVYDLAALLSVISGFDPEDLITRKSIGRIPEQGYLQFMNPSGLRGARLGVMREFFSATPPEQEGVALIERAIQIIRQEGTLVTDPVMTGLDLFGLLRDILISDFEKKYSTNMYLARVGPGATFHSLTEMIERHPKEVHPRLSERNQAGPLDHDPDYRALLKTRETMRRLMIDLMDRYALDALIYPFRTLPAWEIGSGMTSSDFYEQTGANAYNPLSAIADLPALVVPAGFTRAGLPIALEILGRPFSEPTLIRLASGFEAATRHRRTPPHTPPLPGETIEY